MDCPEMATQGFGLPVHGVHLEVCLTKMSAPGSTWLDQSVEHATPALRVVSPSLMLGVQITKNKI